MKSIVLLLFSLILVSCDPVQTSYNQNTDFSQYTSFCWMVACKEAFTGPPYMNDSLIQEHVKNAILSAMESKGIAYDNINPDLIIDFHIVIEEEKVVTYHLQEGESDFYRTTFMQPEETILTKGTITLHIVDFKKGELIWQSEAAGYLDTPSAPSEKYTRKGIIKMLKDFPPRK